MSPFSQPLNYRAHEGHRDFTENNEILCGIAVFFVFSVIHVP